MFQGCSPSRRRDPQKTRWFPLPSAHRTHPEGQKCGGPRDEGQVWGSRQMSQSPGVSAGETLKDIVHKLSESQDGR